LREAEILVHHGVDSILIANEIAGEAKAERLAELSKLASVIVAIDNFASVRLIFYSLSMSSARKLLILLRAAVKCFEM
jgi:D-serine deaminase-like pyridoxal phosphate-dependent protein